ncbi:MAG TPA: glycosyltransferase family 2 protein [Bacteroidales bacterium]
MIKISIITAVRNNRDNIKQCIESVRSQTYHNIEHIVIDGNSTDGTKEIISGHQNQISEWISEPDKSIYDALNKGINLATGDVIGFLHSDDLFDNDSIVEKIALTFTQTHCDAVYGDLLYVSKADPSKVIRYWKSSPFNVKKFRYGWMPAHPTLFMRKTIYDQYGLFDLQYKIAADYDLMLRTVGSGRLACEYLPEIITRMRVGGASNKSLKNIWRKSSEDLHAIRKNKTGGFYTLALKNLSKLGQFLH